VQVLNPEDSVTWFCRFFFKRENYFAANHHLRQFFRGSILSLSGTDTLASSQNRNTVTYGYDFAEFVSNKYYGLALVDKAAP